MSSEAKPRVLFVDDEPRILVAMKALFRNTYDVITANSGADAVEVLREKDVDVIVSDQRMPQMNGVEFLRTAKTLRPRAIRVLLTGYSDLNAILGAINEGEIFRYINKPWSNANLRETIALAADAARAEGIDTDELLEMSRSEADLESGQEHLESAAAGTAPAATKADAGNSRIAQITAGPRLVANREAGLLVLDDDSATRDTLQKVLQTERSVYTASNLHDALDILEKYDVGVLITELAVAGESVTNLLTALRQHHPSLVAIVLTSQPDAGQGIDLINRGQIYRFLSKPVGEGLLRGSVNLAMRRFEILSKNPSQARRLVAEATPEPSQAADKRGIFGRIGRLFGLTVRAAQ